MVLLEIPEGKEIYTTYGESVLSATKRTDLGVLVPCTHEEADTRLMVHALDATSRGHRRIRIRSNDTDVVVLAISVVSILQADEVWVTHGSGKNVQNIPVHAVATSLGRDKASTLPIFHALTGCDTVSFFNGRGKRTAWDVWGVFPELTPVLRVLEASPKEITDDCMAVLERFVVLLYDRTSSLVKVNEVRQELFSKKSRNLDSIPPTRASLEQHVKSAVFQGGTCGAKPSFVSQCFQVHQTGDGSNKTTYGYRTGQPSHKQRTLVTNSSDADVKHHVEEGASA